MSKDDIPMVSNKLHQLIRSKLFNNKNFVKYLALTTLSKTKAFFHVNEKIHHL